MIALLDRLVDTREKRRLLLICIVLFWMICLCIPYWLLGLRLIRITGYGDVFALLKEELLTKTYISRVVLCCLQQGDRSLSVLSMNLIKSLRLWEVLIIILWGFLCHDVKQLRMGKRLFLFSLLIGVMVICICAMIAFSSTTLLEAIQMMKWIGAVLFVLAGFGIILHGMWLWHFAKAYAKALPVEVIEISE